MHVLDFWEKVKFYGDLANNTIALRWDLSDEKLQTEEAIRLKEIITSYLRIVKNFIDNHETLITDNIIPQIELLNYGGTKNTLTEIYELEKKYKIKTIASKDHWDETGMWIGNPNCDNKLCGECKGNKGGK